MSYVKINYKYAPVAQMEEQLTPNEQVAGSIPARGANA